MHDRCLLVIVATCLFIVGACEAACGAERSLPLRAGIIGLDAHALPWTKIINAPKVSGELADMVVVAGYPGGSPDIPQSMELLKERVGPIAELGVEIVDSIEDLLQKIDVVMILSIDGRKHLELLRAR